MAGEVANVDRGDDDVITRLTDRRRSSRDDDADVEGVELVRG
jgi:hypothetical protein